MTRYSICMTTKDDGRTVRESVRSVLLNAPPDTEVVVADAGETPELAQFAGRVKLLRTRGNRGAGRQAAFEASEGEFVAAGIDTDDVVGPKLASIMERYREDYDPAVLKAREPFTMAPREEVERLGGWRPLYWGEDYDFWQRAKRLGALVETRDDPFLRRGKDRAGSPLHVARVFWSYAEAGRTPSTSWKTRPLYAGVELAHRATHLKLKSRVLRRVLAEVGANGNFLVSDWYLKECLDCYPVGDLTGKTVVDVGMDFGTSAMYFRARGAEKVIGYESEAKRSDWIRRGAGRLPWLDFRGEWCGEYPRADLFKMDIEGGERSLNLASLMGYPSWFVALHPATYRMGKALENIGGSVVHRQPGEVMYAR